jgi:hypothetical protein
LSTFPKFCSTLISTLKPAARENLAKVSGIVLAHPRLMLEVEGYTGNSKKHFVLPTGN